MSLVKVFLFVGMLLSMASARFDNARIIGGKEVRALSLLCADDDRQHALYVVISHYVVICKAHAPKLTLSTHISSNFYFLQAIEDRFPYHVSLQDSGGHFCGGSLILKDVVLTAAHCLGGSFNVMIGRHDFDDKDGEIIEAARQIAHPQYDENTSENDFALVVLERPVETVVPLVTLNDDNFYPTPGTQANVMGWGNMKTNGIDLPDVPMIVDVEVISNQKCYELEQGGESYEEFKYDIYDDMICTFTEKKDACQGDSGGPLVISGNDASQDVQIGVVSWGIGCAYLPGVYGRVSYAFDWIKDTACDRSTDTSGSTLCGSPEPTNQPTKQPTPQPTNEPTQQPTKEPTNEPSYAPSLSLMPSVQPSLSLMPSTKPSSFPSESPSSFPSLRPSAKPSALPSAVPSSSPTTSSQPSSQPSTTPSDFPSMSPTFYPTSSPSLSSAPSQSSAPTEAPTETQADRLNTGDSLMINAMELVNGDGKIETSASSNFGSRSAYLGSLISFIITAWLYY